RSPRLQLVLWRRLHRDLPFDPPLGWVSACMPPVFYATSTANIKDDSHLLGPTDHPAQGCVPRKISGRDQPLGPSCTIRHSVSPLALFSHRTSFPSLSRRSNPPNRFGSTLRTDAPPFSVSNASRTAQAVDP